MDVDLLGFGESRFLSGKRAVFSQYSIQLEESDFCWETPCTCFWAFLHVCPSWLIVRRSLFQLGIVSLLSGPSHSYFTLSLGPGISQGSLENQLLSLPGNFDLCLSSCKVFNSFWSLWLHPSVCFKITYLEQFLSCTFNNSLPTTLHVVLEVWC